MEEAKKSPAMRRRAYAIYIDDTKQKIEMNFNSEIQNGKVSTAYMVRVNK